MPSDQQTTKKQVRIVSGFDKSAIGLTIAGTEHVLTMEEAKHIAQLLIEAATLVAQTRKFKSEIRLMKKGGSVND